MTLVYGAARCETVLSCLQARSSKEEWMARGENLMDNLRYEFAARAYNQAGDTVRGAAAAGRHAYQRAREVAGDSQRHKHYLEVCPQMCEKPSNVGRCFATSGTPHVMVPAASSPNVPHYFTRLFCCARPPSTC